MKKIIFISFILFSLNVSADNFNKGADAFDVKDYETALKYWIPLAEEGDSYIQYMVGSVYYKMGEKNKKNYKNSFKWMKKSAKQEYVPAYTYLGFLYSRGLGTKRNEKKAVKLWKDAAIEGHAQGQYNLGHYYFVGAGGIFNRVYGYAWIKISSLNSGEDREDMLNLIEDHLNESELKRAKNLVFKCKKNEFYNCEMK